MCVYVCERESDKGREHEIERERAEIARGRNRKGVRGGECARASETESESERQRE